MTSQVPMFCWTALLGGTIFLSACDKAPEPPEESALTIDVKKFEVATAIVDFMLYENEEPSWSKFASPIEENIYRIRWKTNGVAVRNSITDIDHARITLSYREARTLYWVGGAPLKQLRVNVEPVEWLVTMQGQGLATKSIPTRVEFRPLCDTVECQFDFRLSANLVPSLALREWCTLNTTAISFDVLSIDYPNKKTAYLIISKSWGSGGTSVSLYLAYVPITRVNGKCSSEGI